MEKTVFLSFDRQVTRYGHAEEFFHFMWGYLLPAVFLFRESGRSGGSKFLFQSCGPVMNKRITEIMGLLEIDFEIVEACPDGIAEMKLPRWDVLLLAIGWSEEDTENAKLRKEVFEYLSFMGMKKGESLNAELSERITIVRDWILEEINKLPVQHSLEKYFDTYLVLERSDTPDYYAKGGGSITRDYGKNKRSLIGIEKTVKALGRKGIPIQSFEPGQYSLTEQIKVFNTSKGVIGIKGAEFANLVWCQPASHGLIIMPRNMNSPPIQQYLADILGLRFKQIEGGYALFKKYTRISPSMISKNMELA